MQMSVLRTKVLLILFVSVAVVLLHTSPAFAVRTTTVWTEAGNGGVNVYPYIWSGKDNFFLDFESDDFNNIEYIYYNVEYDTDEQATKRGFEGSIAPSLVEPYGVYQNLPYYREHIPLGTCSGNTCVYHRNVRNLHLTVNTKMLNGPIDQYTKILSFSDDQFNL